MMFRLKLFFAARDDWAPGINLDGLLPSRIGQGDEEGILLFFSAADAYKHCQKKFGDNANSEVYEVICTGIEPRHFEDFLELRGDPGYEVQGQHTYYLARIPRARLKRLVQKETA